MGQAEHESGHIWLRQSATFSVNGQTRTVEIAIPLRPGADADEVERLLSEADAGMERLTRHLDDRVAALTDGAADVPATAPTTPTAPTRAQPAPAARPATPPPAAAPAPALTPAAAAAATATPTAAQRTPAAPANAPRPAASQPAPAARPTPSPSAAPAAGRSTGPLPAAATGAAGADITRIEFIKAAGELGLDVRQAMQRLGVRSLEGLNLRESLELLRRQALRDDGEPAAPTLESAPVSAPSAVARTAAATRPPAPRPAAAAPQPAPYFEEEDEPELTFTIDGEDELDDDYGAYPMSNGAREPVPAGESEYDEVDELELDDVPDFGPPPAASPAGRRIPAGRGSAASQAAPAAKPPTASAAAAPAAPSEPVSEASELIARLRAAHPGGAMSSQQRKAYQNIVVDELGETRATGLIKGIWNVSPDRLGTEQADELLSWGKRETFADEATQVLAELRAERERERGAGGTTGSGGTSARATGSAPRSGAQTRTPGSRTPSGGGGF